MCTVPKVLKDLVWVTYIGEKFKSLCPSCNLYEITVHHFHVGHVISKHDGGTCTLDNLRPTCNTSMRTKNMFDFFQHHLF